LRQHLPFSAFAGRYDRNAAGSAVVAAFVFGLAVGTIARPAFSPTLSTADTPAPGVSSGRAASDLPIAKRLDPSLVYPAEVLRVIDGDTFEARVRVWPGLDVNTKVRLRAIDAPELHARCADELAKAQNARSALETILAEGNVTISRVGVDKYGGRVDAAASTRNTADVAAALLNAGLARNYDGGKRQSWCG
jgi:endonuclease YncB( thermonuclease family)